MQCGCAHTVTDAALCEICAFTHRPNAPDDQRSPGTLSFAIPRGFDGMVRGTHRLAVETELHAVRYAEHEGQLACSYGLLLAVNLATSSDVNQAELTRDRSLGRLDAALRRRHVRGALGL